MMEGVTDDDLHPGVAAVVAAGQRLGVPVTPREFPGGTRTAEDAARAVGCELGQIVKSLAFVVDGAVVMALMAGTNRLDESRLAAAAGAGPAGVRRARADEVRAATGYPIGGVPPFGHARSLRTFVDEDLLGHAEVWCAAGTPRHVFPADPRALVTALGATVVPLAVR